MSRSRKRKEIDEEAEDLVKIIRDYFGDKEFNLTEQVSRHKFLFQIHLFLRARSRFIISRRERRKLKRPFFFSTMRFDRYSVALHLNSDFINILHTETVVAVQELARFRIRALPSHFLLNCAITCGHKGTTTEKISLPREFRNRPFSV